MNINVGVSDMKVSNAPEDIIQTHSLGSCIGVTIYDPAVKVAGLLHFQLPQSTDHPNKEKSPLMFADTGIPELFRAAYKLGAVKKRMIVKVAGGSKIMDNTSFFNIGHRNYIIMKKIFWRNGVLIEAEDIGGDSWRNMKVIVDTGQVVIKTAKGEYDL